MIRRFQVLFYATLLIAGCARERSGQFTVLHTNDMHAQYVAEPATWIETEPKPLIGGMIALESTIRHLSRRYEPVIVLDAGDFMTGTPLAGYIWKSAKGGGIVEMMNHIGYDAVTIGNHEFDEGTENLKKLIGLFESDVLSANLTYEGRFLAPEKYKIYRVGELRVGIIGLILSDLDDVVAKKNVQHVEVLDPVSTAQQLIDKIDAKTDVIILLTHQGRDSDIDLAERITGADIIVGGHSHTRITEVLKKNKILIVQAGSKTRNVGRLTLSVQADSISDYDYELVSTWVDSIRNPDSRMVDLVQMFEKQIQSEYGREIGYAHQTLDRGNENFNLLGNFITDAMREQTGADFAAINSSGIRKNLNHGPVSKLTIHEILPFSNYLVSFRCTGKQVVELLEHNAQVMEENDHGSLALSGLYYEYTWDGDTVETALALIGGRPVHADSVYEGVTVDFITAGNAQKYFGFETEFIDETGILLAESVIDYIRENPDIHAAIEQRIKAVEQVSAGVSPESR